MSTKNIVLSVVCLVCLFFVVSKFYNIIWPVSIPFQQELVRCQLISDWLKKKNISEIAIYGISETLSDLLEKNGIKVDKNISAKPENKINDFFSQVKIANKKAIVFTDPLKETDTIEELLTYLKNGGVIYLRSFPIELNKNELLCKSIIDAMKKGNVCVVMDVIPVIDVRKLSIKERVLAENIFIDDTNFAEFEKRHSEIAKSISEQLKQAPIPFQGK